MRVFTCIRAPAKTRARSCTPGKVNFLRDPDISAVTHRCGSSCQSNEINGGLEVINRCFNRDERQPDSRKRRPGDF